MGRQVGLLTRGERYLSIALTQRVKEAHAEIARIYSMLKAANDTIEALTARIIELEKKRLPGRPPNERS